MQIGLYIIIFILGVYAGSVIENKIIAKDLRKLLNMLYKCVDDKERYIKFLEDLK